VVAADGGEASSRCCRRLELQRFGSDADDATTRVGRQRCPADDRHADDQLCRNTVAVPSFRRRAVIVCHVRTSVVPSCTGVMDVICYSSNITHSSVVTTRRRKLGNLECHELCTAVREMVKCQKNVREDLLSRKNWCVVNFISGSKPMFECIN